MNNCHDLLVLHFVHETTRISIDGIDFKVNFNYVTLVGHHLWKTRIHKNNLTEFYFIYPYKWIKYFCGIESWLGSIIRKGTSIPVFQKPMT